MKILKSVIALILAFLFCISCSIIVKEKFKIDGDYLSAFASLAAAIIAFHLFSDWKEQHKFQLIEKYHTSLKETSILLLNQYFTAKNAFDSIEGSRVDIGEQKLKDGQKELSELLKTLNKVNFILVEYK